MFGLGIGELIVIFFVIFLLFGPKAMPDIARGLGQAIKLFKKEMSKINEEVHQDDESSKFAPDISFKKPEVLKTSPDDFNSNTPRRDWRPKSEEKNNNEAT